MTHQRTVRTINILLLVLVYTFILAGAYLYADHEQGPGCTTDSDCGCLDDCLEPLIQDEAQTAQSQERN
jgi:hypothetical protein